jgi:hypothetical protein
MQDRTATMMIIRSLQDIADELKAVRQELHQMNRSHRAEPLTFGRDSRTSPRWMTPSRVWHRQSSEDDEAAA